MMIFNHRKLLFNDSYGGSEEPPSDDSCKKFCDDNKKICPPLCNYFCNPCSQELSPETATDDSPPPPPPPLIKHHHVSTTILTISLSVFAIFVFIFICYTIYKLYFMWYTSRSRRLSRRRGLEEDEEEEGTRPVHSFHDEDQGPAAAVDHHIWYIRTIGLQPSVISAITIVKFKKGEGLIEGTDCSVCLSEFQENETLRLLPKCNHAFHIPCIDTWLGSHTNCPLCRAPIIVNNTTITPIFNMEEPIMEENPEGTRTSREDESRNEESNDQSGFTKTINRSVSFDSFSAPMAIEDEGKESSNENKFGMNQRLLRLVTSPSNQRSSSSSSSSSSSMKRSFSCSAKV